MAEARRIRLGELLVDAGLLQPGDLERVLELQKAARVRLGKLLVAEGLVDEGQLTQILSHQLSVPWVSLHHIEFSRQLLNLVPAQVADAHDLVPIYVRHVRGQGQTLYLAMEDPQNEEGLAACRSHSGLPVRPMIASPSEIRRAIQVYYGVAPRPAPAPPRPPVPPPRPSAPETSGDGGSPEPGARSPEPETGDRKPETGARSQETGTGDRSPEPEPGPRKPETGSRKPEPETGAGHRKPEPETGAPPRQRTSTVLGGIVAPPLPPAPPDADEEPAPRQPIPQPVGRGPRMVALTLLDGTTIQLPARKPKAPVRDEAEEAPPPSRRSGDPGDLTARDLIAALRAVSHGADASEVLGDQVRWEAMFAALLSLLLKKHLIADWEFVEEYRKHSG
jgi:type IV pilus assembly protein PilB